MTEDFEGVWELPESPFTPPDRRDWQYVGTAYLSGLVQADLYQLPFDIVFQESLDLSEILKFFPEMPPDPFEDLEGAEVFPSADIYSVGDSLAIASLRDSIGPFLTLADAMAYFARLPSGYFTVVEAEDDTIWIVHN